MNSNDSGIWETLKLTNNLLNLALGSPFLSDQFANLPVEGVVGAYSLLEESGTLKINPQEDHAESWAAYLFKGSWNNLNSAPDWRKRAYPSNDRIDIIKANIRIHQLNVDSGH